MTPKQHSPIGMQNGVSNDSRSSRSRGGLLIDLEAIAPDGTECYDAIRTGDGRDRVSEHAVKSRVEGREVDVEGFRSRLSLRDPQQKEPITTISAAFTWDKHCRSCQDA